MNDVQIALTVTFLLTFLICIIDLMHSSDASIFDLKNGSSFLYLIICLIGNWITTVFVLFGRVNALGDYPKLKSALDNLQNASNFTALCLYSFLGVFAFHAIFKNINVTFGGKGFLTLEDYISKARDSAISATTESKLSNYNLKVQKVAQKLRRLTVLELNTHILQHLGQQRLNELDQIVAKQQTDEVFTKALAFATEKFKIAETIS
jgi:hypothetical protein